MPTGIRLHQLPRRERHPLILGKVHDLPRREDGVAARNHVFGPGELLHGVDQQFAALRIEFELGLIAPNELHAVYVSAVVALDGIDDHAAVQLEPDLARIDQLTAERRQPIGWLDRYPR